MTIVRYSASADTTITNAYKMNLVTRATGANMGLADTLEVFSIYGQASTASSEYARLLVNFDADKISTDRTNKTIPASGSVDFFLRMYNAEHAFTLPKDFNLNISAISQSWEEGYGLDMDEYSDLTYDDVGANWERCNTSTAWTANGGDFLSDTSASFTASFENGTEDIEINISPLVEQWIAGNVSDNGVMVMYPSAQEAASRSYYTKKFFARSSQYVLKQPHIEARWDGSIKDNAGSFYLSSSLAPGAQNLNKIYMYNVVRGQLRNIPKIDNTNHSNILVTIYSGTHPSNGEPAGPLYGFTHPIGGGVATALDKNITGSWVETGIYSASFAYTGTATTIFPVWHNVSLGRETRVEYHTGSGIEVKTLDSDDVNLHTKYATTMKNLRDSYSPDEKTTRFRLFIRDKDWNPNTYTKVKATIPSVIVEDAYYKLYRTIDRFEVVAYGTGSANHTRLSYDTSGSYFDFPMDILESGFSYAFKLLYKMPDGNYREQPETFKFRVD